MKKFLLILLFSTFAFGQSGLIARQNFGYKKGSVSFVSTWNTSNTSAGSSASNQVKLPLESSGAYNFLVQWGDGNSNTITVWNEAAVTHTYSIAGTYTITISGICKGFGFAGVGDRLKILSVTSWGGIVASNTTGQFSNCANLNLSTVTDVLNLTGVTNMTQFFAHCTSLTSVNNLSSWDTSSVTTVNAMFRGCTNFNGVVGFDTSTVTNMSYMFDFCTNFNNGLASGIAGTLSLNTSAVTNMNGMFFNNSNFNQNIGGFNVSLVTNFADMLRGCSKFNNGGSSSIGSWTLKTTGTVLITSIFYGCTIFNQPISWNTVAVNNMSYVFYQCTNFNNGLASGVAGTLSLNTSAVTDMIGMFNGCSNFNQNIGGWGVSLVTNFSGMLAASKFNNGGSSSIGSWTLKTTGTIDMSYMFFVANNFNQPLSWNTIAVTTMEGMFYNAFAFQQNIGGWDIRNVTNFTIFMTGKTAANFPSTYLDNIYNGWSTLPSVKPNIVITFGSAKYTAAASAGRAILTGAPNNWTVTDGGI